MSKSSLKSAAGLTLALVTVLCWTLPRQAEARPNYLPVWLETYPEVAKKNNVKAAVKCGVCHVGTPGKIRNDYGKAIIKALDGKKRVRDKDKIVDALKTAAKEKNADGKTFGELLDAGDLPGSK
jgi:hypothetical protein